MFTETHYSIDNLFQRYSSVHSHQLSRYYYSMQIWHVKIATMIPKELYFLNCSWSCFHFIQEEYRRRYKLFQIEDGSWVSEVSQCRVREDAAWSPASYHPYQSSVSSSYRLFPDVWNSTDICWSLKLPLSLGSILVWNQAFQIMCESRLDSRVSLPISSHRSRILLPSPGSLIGKPFGLTYPFLSGVQKPGGPLPRHYSFANSHQHHLKRTKKRVGGIPLPAAVEM